MSYLDTLRLHFSGRFQAAVSTVNNDPDHFDNARFDPSFQQRQTSTAHNGWWNPQGDASWRMLDCAVSSAWLDAETPATAGDPIRSCRISDSDTRVAAKLVDLDPMQQVVSEVWGMQVRICRADGSNLLKGTFATAAFADIWNRAARGGGDFGASAMYQSVLTDLVWDDLGDSPFLQALRNATQDGMLSIKFNVDGYNMDFRSPEFTTGRVTGTIAPYAAGEPHHVVLGRHLMPRAASPDGFFTPQGGINYCVARVDESRGKVFLDLGNALPTQTPGGPPTDLGVLSLGCVQTDSQGNRQVLPLGEVPYTDDGWYETTAGIAVLPAGRALTTDELKALVAAPLCLTIGTRNAAVAQPQAVLTSIAVLEDLNGLYVRADRFVYRVSPGDSLVVQAFATRFGRPYAQASVVCFFDPSQLQGGNVGTPTAALRMGGNGRIVTDAQGRAELTLAAADPGLPRDYIDGQLYGIRLALEETLAPSAAYPFNEGDFVSVLLWSAVRPADLVAWHGGVQPIFQQYANLYPVMNRFLNLADYDSVCANARLLKLAFALPMDDPNSMPVTRDLSPAKRRAILHWLDTPGADGKPLKGEPPVHAAALAAEAPATAAAPAPSPASPSPPARGGKEAALARRLCMRRLPVPRNP